MRAVLQIGLAKLEIDGAQAFYRDGREAILWTRGGSIVISVSPGAEIEFLEKPTELERPKEAVAQGVVTSITKGGESG